MLYKKINDKINIERIEKGRVKSKAKVEGRLQKGLRVSNKSKKIRKLKGRQKLKKISLN